MQKEQVKEPPSVEIPISLKPLPAESGPEKPVAAKTTRLRAGDLCPQCQQERLDYDGLLNLACPRCGIAASGCFTW